MASNDSNDILDVAIVGGGVAGCYAAYRLLHPDAGASPWLQRLLAKGGRDRLERDRLDVTLFEFSDRIGGRLWSHHFPGVSSHSAELGGMCFNELQQNTFGLATAELGLEAFESELFTRIDLQFLRHHRYTGADYVPDVRTTEHYPDVVPYFLRDDEKWQPPPALVDKMVEESFPASRPLIVALQAALKSGDMAEAVRAYNALTIAMRDEMVASTSGAHRTPIHEHGFWNLMAQRLSPEACAMVADATGFYSTFGNWNAYDTTLGVLDFVLEQPYYQLRGGYQSIPLRLAERVEARGGHIRTQTRLCSIAVDETRGEPEIVLTFTAADGGPRWQQRARNVILALPQKALQLLDDDAVLFADEQFLADMSTVTPLPASKLFMTFDRPWWHDVKAGAAGNITGGQSTTDLPLRACYYVGAEDDGKALLLASLNDARATAYWDGYMEAARYGTAHEPYLSESGGAIHERLQAPEAMVADALRQLSELHDCDVPQPVDTVYMDWGADPYGGGWHFWNTHHRSWEVMPRVRRPVPGNRIFLCGEAFSARQGWVEGAINTAEMVLEDYFELPRPDWVHPDYDFGP